MANLVFGYPKKKLRTSSLMGGECLHCDGQNKRCLLLFLPRISLMDAPLFPGMVYVIRDAYEHCIRDTYERCIRDT